MDPRLGNNQGFAALVGVLVFGAIAVSIASTLALSGVRAARSFLALRQGYEAKAAARTCAETALAALQQDTGYTGSGSITVGDASCTYVVTATGGSTRDVSATATVGTVVRSMRVTLDQVTPALHVSSWRDE